MGDLPQITISLESKEKNLLYFLCQFIDANPSQNPILFIRQVKFLIHYLPKSMKEALDQIKKGTMHVLIFENIPMEDELPKTPPDNRSHLGETTTLAKIQALCNQYVGEMVGYQAEGDGRLYQDMVPNKQQSEEQTSLGSKVELELHTEQAFSSYRPDYLHLACLKGNSEAKTYILHINQLLECLTDEEQHMLYCPLWMIGVDLSFVMNGCSSEKRGPIPILEMHNDELVFTFDQDLMEGITDEASALKEKIIRIYQEKRKSIILQPGQMLLFNNRKLVHGRSPFHPKFDGNDRFIIRSFVLKGIKHLQDKFQPNTRTILAQFS